MARKRNEGKPAAAEVVERDLVKLKANDDELIEVDHGLIRHSVTITTLFTNLQLNDNSGTPNPSIPLPEVNGPILKKSFISNVSPIWVLEWAEHHKDDETPASEEAERDSEDDVTEWDKEFFDVDQKTLFDIIVAANYLEMKALLKGACKTVANMIRGKSTEQIRKAFGLVNDFSAEEEAQIKKENAWCMD